MARMWVAVVVVLAGCAAVDLPAATGDTDGEVVSLCPAGEPPELDEDALALREALLDSWNALRTTGGEHCGTEQVPMPALEADAAGWAFADCVAWDIETRGFDRFSDLEFSDGTSMGEVANEYGVSSRWAYVFWQPVVSADAPASLWTGMEWLCPELFDRDDDRVSIGLAAIGDHPGSFGATVFVW